VDAVAVPSGPGDQWAGTAPACGRVPWEAVHDDQPDPLTFISSAFVPPASMPAPLHWFADVNPFSKIINAVRALWLGLPAGDNAWLALV
jgi:hypothetical protein